MNLNPSLFLKPFSIILGGFVGLAAFSSISTAAPSAVLNPCPGIYYEEPHNSLRIVPQGCPPNAATRLLNEQQGQVPLPPLTTQSPPTLSPLPEGNQTALTTIALQAGQVNVRLKNQTNTSITYQAIGHTQQRTLTRGEDVLLQDLSAPVTMTLLRPDGGLVRVASGENSKPGVLVLMLTEATGLSDSQNTVRIQSSGQVFAY